ANFDPDPAIHDGQVAGPDQLVALGDVGEGAGVDVGGVSSNGEGALGYLHVVYDVPVVEANLSCGRFLRDYDLNLAIGDGDGIGIHNLVPGGDVAQRGGINRSGVGIDGNGALADDLALLGAIIVDGDVFLCCRRDILFPVGGE